LMRGGHGAVARAYILYREEHRRAREERSGLGAPATSESLLHSVYDGTAVPIDLATLRAAIDEACAGLGDVDADFVFSRAREALYDGLSPAELGQAPILTVRELVESEPEYSTVAARLLANVLRTEALSHLANEQRQATGAA